MAENLAFAFRSVNGIFLKKNLSTPQDIMSKPMDARTNIIRAMEFSHNGKLLAYCDSERTVCVNANNGQEMFAHPIPKTTRIMFSPDDCLLVTYEPYVIYGSRTDDDGNRRVPNPNLRFFDTSNGNLLATLIQKNQSAWQPQFTEDGQTFVLVENSEVHFHSSASPERFNRKAVIRGVESLKVSPGQDPIIASFVPSKKETNLISLRNFHNDLSVITQKSTFNADKCDLKWNSKGSGCLAIVSVEVDKSNQSYYGSNSVFLLSKTGESLNVPLDKDGPVHDIKWSPSGNQFTVCYGFMPSRVAVFNFKASIIWDMGEGYRNEVHYNPFGTILGICGFGNISAGKINLYDTEQREEIIALEVPDTITFEWAPDGQHFLTATTSPRLRVGNNYRFWNYAGKNLHEHHMVEFNANSEKREIELAQVCFKPVPGVFSRFKIKKLTEKEKRELAQQKKAPTENHPVNAMKKVGIVSNNSVYVPPALRKGGGASNSRPNANAEPKAPFKELSEDEKKMRTLRRKLKDVETLKARADKGEVLEKNQLAKLEKYDELKAELDKIRAAVE